MAQVVLHGRLHPRELFLVHFDEQTVDHPVPVMLPSHPAAHAAREQIAEQIVNNLMPQSPVVPVIDHASTSHEREQQQLEAVALNVVENVFHEDQREVDRCVRVLKREQEKARVLEERAVQHPERQGRLGRCSA